MNENQNPNDNMLLITPELEPRQLPPFFENGVFISDNFSQCDMLLLGMATTASLLLPKFFFRHIYARLDKYVQSVLQREMLKTNL